MSSFPKVTTVFAPPTAVHRVLAAVMEAMGSEQPADKPITEFQVLDDRGGTGHYRVLLPELSLAQARRIISQSGGVYITREDA